MSDEQRGGGAPTDEERARAFREQMRSLHAFDLAYGMMIDLVSFCYQKLGLTDETSELRDLGDARLAIELLRANLEVVEREQGVGRTRDLRSTLAQMQLAGLVGEPQLLVAEAHEADHHVVGEVEGVQAPHLLAEGTGALLVGRRAAPVLLVAHAWSSCVAAVSWREIAWARRTAPANTSGKVSPSR